MAKQQKEAGKQERLVVEMDGAGGVILLRDLETVVQNVRGLLRQADKEGEGEKLPDFCVGSISRRSPMKMEIVRSPGAAMLFPDFSGGVSGVCAALRDVAGGKADDVSDRMIAAMEKMVRPSEGGRLRFFRLGFDGAGRIDINAKFAAKVKEARALDVCRHAAVSGIAELLDLRGGESKKIRMVLHPQIGDDVICLVRRELKNLAISAVDKIAAVRGMGEYRPNSFFPHKIEVEEEGDFDVFDADTPQLSEFEGAFPGLTGGMKTEDYLREIRGE